MQYNFYPHNKPNARMQANHFIFLTLLSAVVGLPGCSPAEKALLTLQVSNPLNDDRMNEVVEMDASLLKGIRSGSFCLKDEAQKECPYQFTSDGKFLFSASVAANGSSLYRLVPGRPAPADTLLHGRQFKERDDDFAWENDRSAYRAYGPALQARGERGFGYDIFTKRVERPVLEKFYANACNQQVWNVINELRRNGHQAQGDSLERTISYHVDHGEGMDVFSVGPTLGAGTAALLDAEGNIAFPWCYERYEVLDQGPLRFTFRLTFRPFALGSDQEVVESRTISLDRGAFLNRTVEHFGGLTAPTPLAAGIPLRPQHPDGFATDAQHGWVAYADSTDNAQAGNGVIYVAALSPAFTRTLVQHYKPEERRDHGNALGHVLAVGDYVPQSDFTYYWGSGWSKGFMPDMRAWKNYLTHFSQCLRHPLEVKVRKK